MHTHRMEIDDVRASVEVVKQTLNEAVCEDMHMIKMIIWIEIKLWS